MGLVENIIDWMLKKEAEMAKSCSIPMQEMEYQRNKVAVQMQKVQQKYNDAMDELNDVSQKLEKIKNMELLRCAK